MHGQRLPELFPRKGRAAYAAPVRLAARIAAGASIINVACAQQTPELVKKFRTQFPELPIIASGGGTGESILRTIQAGANAITYTPPSTGELFRGIMEKNRE